MLNYQYRSRKRMRLGGLLEKFTIDSPGTLLSDTKTNGKAISIWFELNALPLIETSVVLWMVNTTAQAGLWNLRVRNGRLLSYTGARIEYQHAHNNGLLSGGSTIGNVSSTTISTNTKYHVILQTTGSAMQVYINGVLQTITTTSTGDGTDGKWMGDQAFASGNIFIGGAALGSFLNGWIDEVAYFNDNLSQSEINEIYNNGIPKDIRSISAISDLKHYWKVGEGKETGLDTTIYDMKGSLNLTAVGLTAANIESAQY